MRLIDADDFESVAVDLPTGFCEDYLFGFKACLEMLDAAPTVDAVPVVRCIYCVHYCSKRGYCDFVNWFFPADGHCCYGKKRR